MKIMLALSIAGLLFVRAALAASPSCGAEMHPGVNHMSVISGGKPRAFDLTLPASFDRARGVPLVIALHGSGGNGAELDVRTGLSAAGTAKGFAVMLPDGGIPTKRADGSPGFFWNIPGLPLVNGNAVPSDALDDVKFISDAIDHLTKQGCVDAGKVFVTGMSGGGRMTSLLGCRLAIGSRRSRRWQDCAPVARQRLTSRNQNRTTANRRSRYRFCRSTGRTMTRIRSRAVKACDGVTRWKARRHAGQAWQMRFKPTIEKLSGHLTRVSYGACEARNEVVLYEITAPRDQGWRSCLAEGAELKATDVMLDFFSRH